MHLFCTADCGKLPDELVERVESLERTVRAQKIEWEDVLEKIGKTLARLRERQKALERLEPEPEPPALSVHREPGSTHGRMLTDHQMEIQQNILKRRAGG